MRFQITLFVAMIISLFITGCGGGGGGSDYDGNWTASYTDPASVPVAGVDQTVACTNPPATITLVNGSGSTKQTQTCVITTTTTTIVIGGTNQTSTTTATQVTDFLISAAINGSNAVINAIVNGAPLAGKCISTVGCSAQAATGKGALGLTR
jgi:hypothetical protein